MLRPWGRLMGLLVMHRNGTIKQLALQDVVQVIHNLFGCLRCFRHEVLARSVDDTMKCSVDGCSDWLHEILVPVHEDLLLLLRIST
jgi:hypothetical protein